MVYIPDKLREQVIARAKGLCEYCQTNRDIVVYMEIDHIRPVSKGGKTEAKNLCLACVNCNRAKSNLMNEDEILFDPRTDYWDAHFKWDKTRTHLIALTSMAQRTIDHLNMNNELVVKARVFWVKAGWHPPKLIN
jgi:5-methylcytosine-specific restriction endonuclease McrA